MARKNYKGVGGKSIWENANFRKGIRYTDEPLNEGTLKMLSNWDISSTGASMKPRLPFYNMTFKMDSLAYPIAFSKDTIMFSPRQQSDKHYFISIGGERYAKDEFVLVQNYAGGSEAINILDNIEVLDGDTIRCNGIRYRLLGIDAPDDPKEDDPPEWADYKIASKDHLVSLLQNTTLENFSLLVKYDKNSDGDVDVYGRQLVWLIVKNEDTEVEVNINSLMLYDGFARIQGEYGEDAIVQMLNYDEVNASLLISHRNNGHYITEVIRASGDNVPWPAAWGKENAIDAVPDVKTIESNEPSNNIAIYSKYYNTEIQSFKEFPTDTDPDPDIDNSSIEVPTIDVTLEGTMLDLSQLYKDLGISYGADIDISLNTLSYNAYGYDYDYRGDYRPWTRYDDIDGLAMLCTIKSKGVEKYKGLTTLRYDVPLEGNIPQFDKATFKLETYNENAYEIRFEDLDTSSPNLLDPTLDELKSYYGQEAIDEDYYSLEIRFMKVTNSTGKIITVMEYGKTYTVLPIIVVPSIDAAVPAPDGYAIKWEFFDLDPADGGVVVSTIDWHMAFDREGVKLQTYNQDVFGIIDDATSVFHNYAPGADYTSINTDSGWLKDFDDGVYAKFYITRASLNAVTSANLEAKQGYYIDGRTYDSVIELDPYGDGTRAGAYYPISLVTPITPEAWAVTEYIAYGRTEKSAEIYQHGQELNNCTGIAYYDGRIVLYGNPNAANILYLSDYNGNISYFPDKWALDQFNEDVVHVHIHNNSMIVFTQTDIYIAYEAVTDVLTEATGVVAVIAMSNITIKGHNRNTVRSIGKDVLFMSDDKLNLLRPNPYVTDVSDMYLTNLSKDIAALLADPTDHIITRLQYYGKIGEDILDWKPKIENYVTIKENEIWVYMSVYMETISQIFMMIAIYDTLSGTWKTYDTLSYSHPYQTEMFNSTEGNYTLSRNHHTRDGGVTLLIDNALNLWEFDDTLGSLFDFKAVQYINDTFIYNTALNSDEQDVIDEVKHPLLPFISTGYPNISNHVNKRFHKMYLEITNKDSLEIPILLEFQLDGKVRQTSKSVRLTQVTDVASPTFGTIYSVIERKPVTLFKGGLTFETWLLGFTPFKPTGILRLDLGLSGRGRSAMFNIGFIVRGKFEFYKYGLIYKEQTVR